MYIHSHASVHECTQMDRYSEDAVVGFSYSKVNDK